MPQRRATSQGLAGQTTSAPQINIQQPASPQQSQPMQKLSKKEMKQLKKQQRKEQKEKAVANGEPNRIEKILFYVKTNSVSEMISDFFLWLDTNYFAAILFSALCIVIGLLFNRYFSFGAALVMVIVGVIMSQKDYDRGAYALYAAALLAFIIPYLF